ncbi:MAG: winged helix-turn-helix transcriptional regulator [Nitrosopumilus sp.]|nr:winged helix-turn-helix transcriptional regulator [Nitrosopumilus sp.]MDH3385672.1 winged helix-turn-helix transcriptional regulator [Nitrosopumilus sp.]
MESESKDLIVLATIMRGEHNFDKIKKNTKIDAEELNSILEKLEERGLITVKEKKGFFGSKVEIIATEKGSREVDERVFELQQKWNQMSLLYKSGNKDKLKQYMDENKSILPTMMFFGIMDMMMFSMMFSMMGMMMTDYIPQETIPEGMDGDADMSDGGFDFDIGF